MEKLSKYVPIHFIFCKKKKQLVLQTKINGTSLIVSFSDFKKFKKKQKDSPIEKYLQKLNPVLEGRFFF